MSKTIQIEKVDDKATEELSNLSMYDDYKKSLDDINLLLDYLKQYKNDPLATLDIIDVNKFSELKEVANDVKSAKEFGLNSVDIPDRIMASSLLNTIRGKIKALCNTKLLNTDYIKYMLVDLNQNVNLLKEREHRHETYYPDFRNNWNIPKLSNYIDKMLPQSYDKILLYGKEFSSPVSAILGVGYGIIGLIDLLNSYISMTTDRYLAICNDVKMSQDKVVDPTITSSIVVTIANDKNIRLDKPFSNERVLKFLKTYDKSYGVDTPTGAVKLFIEDILKTLPHKFNSLYSNYLKLANATMLAKDNDIILSLKNIYANYAKPYGEDKLLEEDYNKGVYFFRNHVRILLEAHEELVKILLLIGKYIRSVAINIHKIYQTSINIGVLTQ
jgi:hypothetical protein